MNIYQRVFLSLKIGFYVGLLTGTIDIISRVFAWSFEWFEFYQVIVLSLVFVALVYFVFGISLEFLRPIIKKFPNYLVLSYIIFTVLFLLSFYSYCVFRDYIFHAPQYSLKSTILYSMVFAVFGTLVFVIVLKKQLLSVALFFGRPKIRTTVGKYTFFVFTFLIASFVLDVATINNIPEHKSYTSLAAYPNVILISVDAMRADRVSHELTPFLEKLVNSSAFFTNAKTVSASTFPVHVSMLSGIYPYHHKATVLTWSISNNTISITKMIPKEYVTAGFVSIGQLKGRLGFNRFFNFYKDRLDFFDPKGFTQFSLSRLFWGRVMSCYSYRYLHSDDIKKAEGTNGDVLEWLQKNKNHPFFLFIHYADIHSYPLAAFDATDKVPDEEDVMLLRQYYDKQVQHVDRNIETLFNSLNEMELLQNSIIVITADHGEEFMEHGVIGRKNERFEEQVNVPLMIYYPSKIEPQKRKERVSTVDITPTILDLMGVKHEYSFDGRSLLPYMLGEKMEERKIYVQDYGRSKYGEDTTFVMYDGPWKMRYVVPGGRDYSSALFNLELDPAETKNLRHAEKERYGKMMTDLMPIIAEGHIVE